MSVPIVMPYGAAINGIVESYLIAAGKTISAGDFVSFVNEAADEIVKNQISTPSAGTEEVFNNSALNYISAVTLSSTSALIAYRDNDNSYYGTSVILTISGTTITIGTPVVFNSASTNYISVVALSATKVLVIYRDNGNSGYGTSVILTISGTTITIGTPVVFSSSSTYESSAVVLSLTSVLVAYRDNGNSNYGASVVLTISGTTITTGTSVVFNSAFISYISAVTLSSTSALIAYKDGGNSSYGTSVILTISGTTITIGTPVVFNSANTDYISVVALSATKALVAYCDWSNSYYGTSVILTISGTTITIGTPVVFNSATTYESSAVVLSLTSVLVAYRDNGNSGYGTAIVLSVSGTTITPGIPVVFYDSSTSYISVVVLSPTNMLVAYQAYYTGMAKVLTIPQMLNIVGVAKESGIGGNTIDVYTPNVPVLPAEEVDLSPYILNLAGTLTLTGTYSSSTYITSSGCRLACNGDGEVIIVIKGGTSTSYENILFSETSLPDGVSLLTGSSTFDTSDPAGNYYCCILTGVTAKLDVTCDFSSINGTYDYLVCALTVTVAS